MGDRMRCSRCGQGIGATDVTCPACGHPLPAEEDVVQQARTLMRQKQYSRVVSLLSGWVELHPEDEQAWEMLGAAYFALEMFAPAEEVAAKVVSLKPESARAWCNWGTLLRKVGRLEDAQRAQLRCLELDPGYGRARSELRKISRMKQEQTVPVPTDLFPMGDVQAGTGEETISAVGPSGPRPDAPTFAGTDTTGATPPLKRRWSIALFGAMGIVIIVATGLVALGLVKHLASAPGAARSASPNNQPAAPPPPAQRFSPQFVPSAPQVPPSQSANPPAQPAGPTYSYAPQTYYPTGAAAASPASKAFANPPGLPAGSDTAGASYGTEAKGTIRGTVTFYFNDNFRTQPDIGSEVLVLRGDWSQWPVARMSVEQTVAVEAQSYARTMADGNGNYSLQVPPGTWTVVIYSAHTRGFAGVELLHKIYQTTVCVSPGETVDVSHDFGITWF